MAPYCNVWTTLTSNNKGGWESNIQVKSYIYIKAISTQLRHYLPLQPIKAKNLSSLLELFPYSYFSLLICIIGIKICPSSSKYSIRTVILSN